jgi:hypothetical protein
VRGRIDDGLGGNPQRFTGKSGLAGPLACRGDVNAMVAQDLLQALRIHKARHIVQRHRFRREQRNDHERQGGVLGAGNVDRAVERVAAADANAIHV